MRSPSGALQQEPTESFYFLNRENLNVAGEYIYIAGVGLLDFGYANEHFFHADFFNFIPAWVTPNFILGWCYFSAYTSLVSGYRYLQEGKYLEGCASITAGIGLTLLTLTPKWLRDLASTQLPDKATALGGPAFFLSSLVWLLIATKNTITAYQALQNAPAAEKPKLEQELKTAGANLFFSALNVIVMYSYAHPAIMAIVLKTTVAACPLVTLGFGTVVAGYFAYNRFFKPEPEKEPRLLPADPHLCPAL